MMRLLSLFLVGAVAACGATYNRRDGVIHAAGVGFRVGTLPSSWTETSLGGNRIAFHHQEGGTISAGSQCPLGDDVPLDVLTNHLLMGFSNRKVERQRRVSLDGRAALETRATAELDGVLLALELVVLKKDGCLFDLQLVGAPGTIGARRTDFARFWQGFHVLASR